MSNSPENDSEYSDLLSRIVRGAEYLDNPLITASDHTKGMKLYDELCDRATKYHKK